MTNTSDRALRAIFGWSAGWGIAGLSVGVAAICSGWSPRVGEAIFVAGSACGVAFGAYWNERSYDHGEVRNAIRPVLAWALSAVLVLPLFWNWRWVSHPSVVTYTGRTPDARDFLSDCVFVCTLLGAFGGVISTLAAARPWRRPPVDALLTGAGWAIGCAAGASIYIVTAYSALFLSSPVMRALEAPLGRTVAGGLAALFSTGIGGLFTGLLAASIGVSIERFVAMHFGRRVERDADPAKGGLAGLRLR
jgi:hypothetical protein